MGLTERTTDMEDVLGYAGKSVVVTGAASGMGEATARILVDLGAKVTALDIKPTTVDVAASHHIDLRDRASIEEVAAAIEGPVDGLFSCAGLPGPPFSEWDTILVNFVGARGDQRDLVLGGDRLAGPHPGDHRAVADQRVRRGGRVAARTRAQVVVERLRLLEVHHRRLGGLVVSGTGQAGNPDQLHQPRSHADRDDAGVPGPDGQGGHRLVGGPGGPVLDAGGAGVAAGVPGQPAVQLRRR
ncbi:dehydrogenase [Mycolicibacterium phlei]|nr:dehydrogenase [Mycolicibacterium phlei]